MTRRFLVTVVLCAACADPPPAPVVDTPVVEAPRMGITPGELAVVVNDNDPASVALGNYYATARGLPAENVIHVTFTPNVSVMTETEFNAAAAALDAALPAGIQGLALTWTLPFRVECMSVTSAFALGYDASRYCSTPCNPTGQPGYYQSLSSYPVDDHNVRPTMALVGGEATVDRGVAADDTHPTGRIVMITTTDANRSVRSLAFEATVDMWDPAVLDTEHIDNAAGAAAGDTIANETDLFGYQTGLTDVADIATNTFLPGALAEHLTSYGGVLDNSQPQMTIDAWLSAGATASYGTVVEPCNFPQKFPDSRQLWRHYYTGATALEAYWKSVQWPGEGIFIGEPLATPFGAPIVDYTENRLTIRTTHMITGAIYDLKGGESPEGNLETVLSGITVDTLHLAEVELNGVYFPYYALQPR